MDNIKVVIGSQFGDEGKGLMTDYFCQKAEEEKKSCLVVLNNGGAQRGHTVDLTDDFSHTFHHFGSGTFSNADTYCSQYFILNPMTFVKEYIELSSVIDFNLRNIYINPECKWSTPYDMLLNQIVEASRGDKKHGSCGMGIWETECRYNNYGAAKINILEFNDLMTFEAKVQTLKLFRDIYFKNRLNQYKVEIPDYLKDIWYSDNLIYHFIDDVKFMCEHVKFVNDSILYHYDTIVFENGQGLLLDQSLTDFYGDNLTPSNTGSQNAAAIINSLKTDCNIELCYVSRTYMTRHGAGRFETECDKSLINKDMLDRNNRTNEFQGDLRYGELILPNLITRVSSDAASIKNAKVSLAFTHMNEFNNIDFDRLKNFNTYISNTKFAKDVKRAD